jgi:hypothetical protein
LEPPGVWAVKAAEAMGLTGQVDPETYWAPVREADRADDEHGYGGVDG